MKTPNKLRCPGYDSPFKDSSWPPSRSLAPIFIIVTIKNCKFYANFLEKTFLSYLILSYTEPGDAWGGGKCFYKKILQNYWKGRNNKRKINSTKNKRPKIKYKLQSNSSICQRKWC